MLLDDFVECGEDGRDGVVRRAVVVLRVAGWKLLNEVSHRVFACGAVVERWLKNGSYTTSTEMTAHRK